MKYGEIIELGAHRLMCGDATSRDDVMRLVDGLKVDLVLTDPPYGIKVMGKGSTGSIGQYGREYKTLIGDMNTDMAREHYHIARTISNKQIIWGGQNFTNFFWSLCRKVCFDETNTLQILEKIVPIHRKLYRLTFCRRRAVGYSGTKTRGQIS